MTVENTFLGKKREREADEQRNFEFKMRTLVFLASYEAMVEMNPELLAKVQKEVIREMDNGGLEDYSSLVQRILKFAKTEWATILYRDMVKDLEPVTEPTLEQLADLRGSGDE